MSKYHEVSAWPTDAGWRVGFHSFDAAQREFNFGEFEYVSPPRLSVEEALRVAPYPNPGGFNEYTSEDDVKQFERMAWDCQNPKEAAALRQAEATEWRRANLLECVMPLPGQHVILEYLSKSGTGMTRGAVLARADDGSLVANRIDWQGKRETITVLLPDGQIPDDSELSGIQRDFSALPGPSRNMTGAQQNASRECGANTPLGPCRRKTFAARCWQHS